MYSSEPKKLKSLISAEKSVWADKYNIPCICLPVTSFTMRLQQLSCY